MPAREKVGKSRNSVFFQWFVAPEGRKVGLLKRRVRSHLARWDEKLHAVVVRSTFPSQSAQNTSCSGHFWKLRCRKSARRCGAKHMSKSKNAQNTPASDHFWKLRCRKSACRCGAKYISKSKCTKHIILGPLLEVEMSRKCTLLWREAHFEVKMHKAHQLRTTFGSWDVEKMHAVVARSTCRSQNAQGTPASDHFWKLRCRKSARRCGAKHMSKSKCTRHTSFGPLLEVEMSKKCTPLWRQAHFEVKMYKNTTCWRHFWRFRCRFAWQAQGIVHLLKSEQNVRVLLHFQNDGRRGTFEEDLQRCIFRGRRSTRDMFIKAVRRSGRWFPERGSVLEPQIFRFAEMI